MLAPDTILRDRYRILGLLGKGGMGAIYEAVDRELSCTVAIKENLALTEELRYAFTREAKLLANLQHPALPNVMDHFSMKDGQFLVMEFISGKNLAEILVERKNSPFSPTEVMSWAYTLLDVLEYLHSKPIIHGDIKPANLKLNADGSLFLLDFGLAKGKAGLMSSLNTSFPVLGYTASYAPVEQILIADVRWYNLLAAISSEKANDILKQKLEPRSDLYSLGATLYHLITGSCPPEATTRAALTWAGQPDPVVLASQLNPQVAPEFAGVLTCAMALRREERFSSAAEMRQALRDAGRPSVLVDVSVPRIVDKVASPVATTLKLPPSVPTVVRAKYGVLGTCDSSVRSVAFSPNGGYLASGSNDNMVRLWDVSTGEMRILGQCDFNESGFSFVSSVCFSPDGRYIASGSSDETVRIWDTQADEMRVLGRGQDSIYAVAFSPDGESIASGSGDGNIHLWNFQTGEVTSFAECDSVVWSLAFSPDGNTIASEDGNRKITLWNVESRQPRVLKIPNKDVWSVVFSKDGTQIASGSWDQHVRIWNVKTGQLRILGKCDGVVRSVAFSPDRQHLASASDDCSIRLWDIQSGEMRVVGFCEDVVSTVAFSPDGQTIASGSWDNTVRLWKAFDPEVTIPQ
jgi:serine/threonine protein kinase